MTAAFCDLKSKSRGSRSLPQILSMTGSRTLLLVLTFFFLCAVGGQAQTFAPIPTLYFTKIFAGADPLPQTITLTSTGMNFSSNGTVSTSTGGNWLSLSGSSCSGYCGTTPNVVTVNVNPAVTLQPGMYAGQIVFSSGSKVITIQVVLTIVAVGQATFDTLPGQLAFSMATNTSGPPSEIIQVRNAATSGSLAWTVTASTADGGAWLVPSLTTGTAPSFLTISMVKANLPGGGSMAGNFIGMLRFQSGAIIVTIPVNVNIYDNVFPQINPISFTKVFGGANPLPQVITIAATIATSNFSIALSTFTSTGGNWLSLSGPACSGSCGTTPQNITVLVTPAIALPVGTYTGQILITSGGLSQTVPVTLTVAASTSPVFDNMPGQLSFLWRKVPQVFRGNSWMYETRAKAP